jgi:hypothetical protein
LKGEVIKVGRLLEKIREKIQKRSGNMNHYQETSATAEEERSENAREEIADRPTVETAKKLVVVGRESVFSQEIIDYALEMAERMSYEIIALNTAPLSCETFKLFSSSRNKICEDFEDLSKKNVRAFQEAAEKKGIPFTHVVKFSESYEVLKELKVEIGGFEFVVSEMEEQEDSSGTENGKTVKREICVYSIM